MEAVPCPRAASATGEAFPQGGKGAPVCALGRMRVRRSRMDPTLIKSVDRSLASLGPHQSPFVRQLPPEGEARSSPPCPAAPTRRGALRMGCFSPPLKGEVPEERKGQNVGLWDPSVTAAGRRDSSPCRGAKAQAAPKFRIIVPPPYRVRLSGQMGGVACISFCLRGTQKEIMVSISF